MRPAFTVVFAVGEGAMRVLALAALALGLAGAPGYAQKSADTLRVAWRDAVSNLDPYYNQQRTGLVLAHHVWDGLIYRDPETFALKPLLAVAWKQVDETTIDFELRRNVTFHDGSPFGADDVVYTLNRIRADPLVAVPSNYAWLEGVEKLDEFQVRVKLKRVFPAALEYLAMATPIWPQGTRERLGAEAYGRAPVGTGPYRIVPGEAGAPLVLERFEGYFAESAKARPAIRRVVIDQVADPAAEMAELVSGRADWIWNIPAAEFDRIPASAGLQTLQAESMRVGYLSLDAAGRTGAEGPLTKLKVRQAIFHAIDRPGFVKAQFQGSARALDAPCFPTQFGCDASAAVRYEFNPAKAKALLAEAGYPEGFTTELYSYVPPLWTASVQASLKAVGIEVVVNQQQLGAVVRASEEGRTPLRLAAWGSFSVNDVSAFLPFFFGGGANDYTRDPEITRLIEAAGASTKADERRKLYSAAIKRITEAASFMPLHTYVTTYAISRALNFKPFPDELPRFYLASWK